jgi:Uma2 family endonuclease
MQCRRWLVKPAERLPGQFNETLFRESSAILPGLEQKLASSGALVLQYLMTALLELPAIRERAFSIPVEVYHRLSEGLKTELLRGTIIKKMSKSPLHIFIAHRLGKILAAQIRPGHTLFVEGSLTTADSEPEPDLCIVQGEAELFRTEHPTTAELVIEVAVTSIEVDRVKALIYSDASVKEYWIVRPQEKQVEVYRQPTVDGYAESAVASGNSVLSSSVVPGVQVDLGELFS